MNRMAAFLPAMLFVVGVGTSSTWALPEDQTAGAQDRSQALRVAWGEGDVEASVRDGIEAPRMAAREDEVQAPRADDVQAPREGEDQVQAPHAGDVGRPVDAPPDA